MTYPTYKNTINIPPAPHNKKKNIASIENNAIGSTVEVTSLWNKGVASLREMTGQKKE